MTVGAIMSGWSATRKLLSSPERCSRPAVMVFGINPDSAFGFTGIPRNMCSLTANSLYTVWHAHRT